MEITNNLSSGYLIPLFLLLTVGIFIFVYLLRFFIPILYSGKMSAGKFRKYIAVLEGVIWGVFLLTATVFFLKHNIILSAILFLIILLLCFWYSQFALRDYIAGLVFKSENRFSLNEIIEIGEHKGEIKNFHHRNIEIEDENGKRIYLPYSALMGIISSPQKVSETVISSSFDISIYTDQPFDMVVDQLKKYIYSLPWTVLKNEPKISLLKESDNCFIVKITFFSFDEAYLQPIKKRIEEFISRNFPIKKSNQIS